MTKIPLHERLYCVLNEWYCERKYSRKEKAYKKLHENITAVTHAATYHLETLYISILGLVMGLAFVGNSMFADTTANLKTNDYLIYPLTHVTTFSCRQQMKPWSELPDSCKVPLPIIKDANYDEYRNDLEYKNIYTVLWGDTYKGNWENDRWDHGWVDIATASGTPLYSLAHGVVTFAGTQAWYGNVVKIMFKYKGVTYHAVYAHMKSIDVRKGDMVTQWQKVWEVGNTGSTFGALGGNHIHFEIDKDNGWRPAFYYQWCPALETNTLTQITNGGLCREYREKYSYDPIAFIEASQKNKKPIEVVHNTAPEQNEVDNKPDQNITDPVDPTILTDTPLVLRPIVKAKLTSEAIDFFNKRNIQIVANTSSQMNLGQEWNLIFTVTNKATNKKFDGPLPVAFELVSADSGISTSTASIAYLKKWEQKVNYTTHKKGKVNLAISLWGQTIAVLTTTVL